MDDPELNVNLSASVDRRANAGQQSFRIRKFSRQGSLSRSRDSMSARGETMNSAQKMSAMKKTIDSEDEDDDMVIQARNRSRTAKGDKVGDHQHQRESSEAA